MTMLVGFSLLWGATGARAGDALPPLVVRHSHYFVVVSEGATAPALTLRSKGFAAYPDGMSVQVVDDRSNLRLDAFVPVGAELSRAISGAPAPLYLVVAEPGMNGVLFGADQPWGVVAAGSWGLGTNGPVPRMHLYVPPECESIDVTCECTSPNEGVRLVLSGPDGAEALVMDGEFDSAGKRTLQVPPEHRGKAWSVAWARAQTVPAGLDDVALFVDGYLAPVLWPMAEWAERHGPTLWQRHRAALGAGARP